MGPSLPPADIPFWAIPNSPPSPAPVQGPTSSPVPSTSPSDSLKPSVSPAPTILHPSCLAAQNGDVYETPFSQNVSYTYEVLTTIDWNRTQLLQDLDDIFQGFLVSDLVDCLKGDRSDVQGIGAGLLDQIQNETCTGITFFDRSDKACYVVEGSMEVYLSGYATLTTSKITKLVWAALRKELNESQRRHRERMLSSSLIDEEKGILDLYFTSLDESGGVTNTDSATGDVGNSKIQSEDDGVDVVMSSAIAGVALLVVAMAAFIFVKRRKLRDDETYLRADTPRSGVTFDFAEDGVETTKAASVDRHQQGPDPTWSADHDVESHDESSTSSCNFEGQFPKNGAPAHAWSNLAAARMALASDRMDQENYTPRGKLSEMAEKNERALTLTMAAELSQPSFKDRNSIPKTPPKLAEIHDGGGKTPASSKSRRIESNARTAPRSNVTPKQSSNPTNTPVSDFAPKRTKMMVSKHADPEAIRTPQTPVPTKPTRANRNSSDSSSGSSPRDRYTPGQSARAKQENGGSSWTKKVNIHSYKEQEMVMHRAKERINSPVQTASSPYDEESSSKCPSDDASTSSERYRIDATGMIQSIPDILTPGDEEYDSPRKSEDFYTRVRADGGGNYRDTKRDRAKSPVDSLRPRTSYNPYQNSSASKVLTPAEAVSKTSSTAHSVRDQGRRALSGRKQSAREKEVERASSRGRDRNTRASTSDIHERVWKRTYEANDINLLVDTSSEIEPVRERSPDSSISTTGRRSLTPSSSQRWVMANSRGNSRTNSRASSRDPPSTKGGMTRTLSNSSFAVIMDAFDKIKLDRAQHHASEAEMALQSESIPDPIIGTRTPRNDTSGGGQAESRNDESTSRRRQLILEARRNARGRTGANTPVNYLSNYDSNNKENTQDSQRRAKSPDIRKSYRNAKPRQLSQTPEKKRPGSIGTTTTRSATGSSKVFGARSTYSASVSSSHSKWTPSPYALEPRKPASASGGTNTTSSTAISPAHLRFTDDVKKASRGAFESSTVEL